ncbi:cyclic AMP-dependent transcription factor ATF-4 [Microcaecilia unicolor]|uniref:Cyclic AMP-dependent transcription factor ATF-4 n=1 Tax=Microcaecilia unicolor TaxID=1415580 RepID=A0A6P7Y9T4_9AMPH|nr:cyclic AMP-dependent transcription factor ATF-4 [Microcaecilia unicolor]
MSLLGEEIMLGDLLSPLSQSSLAAEESLGLLDEYLEVVKPLKPQRYSSHKANEISSSWLSVDTWDTPTANTEEDAFSGMDWMVEKNLKDLDFDSLLNMEDMDAFASPDELMASLEDTHDFLNNPPFQAALEELPAVVSPFPELLGEDDQLAPLSPSASLILSPEHLTTIPYSFSVGLVDEADVKANTKPVAALLVVVIPKSEREEEVSSDDSGICLSPESYLGSPQHSPASSVASPASQSQLEFPKSGRPKPYDLPTENKTILTKVKVASGEKKDKKMKKMEQNKTAATRYRQKKRAEQEAISSECRQLEERNSTLTEKVDSLTKEICYLKDLIEEVRTAKNKRAKKNLN